MQISTHYAPYTEPVLLTIVGNTCARFFYANDRTIEELKKVEWTENENDRIAFFTLVGETVRTLLKKTPGKLHLCAIEIEKLELSETIERITGAAIERVIAKNLSALPLDAILRILHEQHGA